MECQNFHWQSQTFEMAVSKPISLWPDLVILSKDHFESMRLCVCVCVCARVHSGTLTLEAVLFGKLPEREPTQHGRWREEQSKQGTYTGEKRGASAALGHARTHTYTNTDRISTTHTSPHPSKHMFLYPAHILFSLFSLSYIVSLTHGGRDLLLRYFQRAEPLILSYFIFWRTQLSCQTHTQKKIRWKRWV